MVDLSLKKYESEINLVDIVIVTYGERWHFLEKVLSYLEHQKKVDKIYIVDNASKYPVSEFCNKMRYEKVYVIRSDKNLGSAGGYSLGIRNAVQNHNAGLIFLLDDDNLPDNGSIDGLLLTYENLIKQNPKQYFIVQAYRDSIHRNLSTDNGKLLFSEESFIGFNVFNKIQRYFRSFRNKKNYFKDSVTKIEFVLGTYGGLLIPKKIVSLVGLPLSKMILYYDDVEYIYRMQSNNVNLFLDGYNEVFDIEKNTSTSFFSTPVFDLVFVGNECKLYYLLRNRLFLDSAIFKKNSVAYKINKFTLIAFVLFFALIFFRFERIKTIYNSLIDAHHSRLGFNANYNLE